jgi:hypothetical protein
MDMEDGGYYEEDERLGPDEVELSDWSDDDESITFTDPLSMYGAGGLVQSADYRRLSAFGFRDDGGDDDDDDDDEGDFEDETPSAVNQDYPHRDVFWSPNPHRAMSPPRGRVSADRAASARGMSQSPNALANPLDEYAAALQQVRCF